MTEPLHIQLQPYFQSRKNFYEILYVLFLDPKSGEHLFSIRDNGDLNILEEVHEGGKILRRFFEHLSSTQIQAEHEEYHRLLIGPGPLIAPPWESYYRSHENLLFEECNYEVRKLYHQFGLQNSKENNEPDDHLLLELEFMIFLSNLCLTETNVDRFEEILFGQIKLLQNHLTMWIPYFSRRIIENTNSQLYLGAAMLLEDFLSYDLQSLLEVKEVISNV